VTKAGDDDNEWVVSVEWSEPFVSCSGSVSQYVLSVTPPTSDCQSGSQDCQLSTDQTQLDLTLTVDQTYSLSVRADTCDYTGNYSEPVTIRVYDGTLQNAVRANYNPYSGILGTISLYSEEFLLEFNETDGSGMEENENTTAPMVVTNYNYTVAISGVTLTPDGFSSYSEYSVTSVPNYTFDTPPGAIAEYNVTIMVNIAGATPVVVSNEPIMSEDPDADFSDMFSVDINSSCNSTVTCTASESLKNCTAYCGAADSIFALTNNDSSTGVGNGAIPLTLAPPMGDRYHCIVTGVNNNGSIAFRGQETSTVIGCPVNLLLDTMNVPDCKVDGDKCSCTLVPDDGRFSVGYGSTLEGSPATLSTPPTSCFDRPRSSLVRTCERTNLWIGADFNTLIFTPASEMENLSDWNIALIVVGALLSVAGLVILVWFAVLLSHRVKASEKVKVQWWFWVLVAASGIVTLTSLALWIALGVVVGMNEFPKGGFYDDDAYKRLPDSTCERLAPNSLKNGLVVACFVVALLVPIEWASRILLMKWGVKSSVVKKEEPVEEHKLEEVDAYSSLSHANKPSSPQPLLSDTDSGYRKLHQSDDDPGHYGKLDRIDKKPAMAAVAPTGDSEYGKLDRSQMQEEPGHYGKLDHPGVKTSTLPVNVSGTSEYGKLDRDPLHYGKLDHPGVKTSTLPVNVSGTSDGKRGATLPGAVPPIGESYGKLDRTQMQVAGGAPGDVYDTVTDAPRHVPKAHSKSRRQTGEEASLL
jgi:hypothetical protein